MPRLSPFKNILIWLVVLAGLAFALPNLLSREQLADWPTWLPHRQVPLGLDLRGGSHIVLKVSREDIVAERLQSTIDTIADALRQADIRYTGLSGSGQGLQFRLRDATKAPAARDALKALVAPVRQGGLFGNSIQELVYEESATSDTLRLRLTDEGIDLRVSDAVAQSIEVVRRRVGEVIAVVPIIERRGGDRLSVQVPGLDEPQRLKDLLGQRGDVALKWLDSSMPAQQAVDTRPPAGSEVLYSLDDPPIPYLVERRAFAAAPDFVEAQPGFDPATSEPVVNARIAAGAAARVAPFLQSDPRKQFAIVLDGQVISTSVLDGALSGDAVRISGNLSEDGANDLAALMRAGPLPVSLTVIEERTVGPEDGADAVANGLTAGLIAAIAVAACMIGFYGFFGVVAVIAVIVNVVLIIAVLSVTGATLTLPGIAGIILTIGIAVDSNVLIYERLREEARTSGKPLRRALDDGFERVLRSIVDANLTIFIAGAILLYLGSGAIRGFAVTLAIGSVTTILTAHSLTRRLIRGWYRRRLPQRLPRGIRTGFFSRADFRFMAIRNPVFILMTALSLASLVLLTSLGLNMGADFRGGSVIELRARTGVADGADIRARLDELNLGDVQVEELGSARDVLVRIPSQEAGDNAEQTAVGLVRSELEDQYVFRRVEVVGPGVSGELTRAGSLAVAAAVLAVLLYVWLRFGRRFAVGAIVATLHDVLLTLGFLVLTGIEFNLASIAALLTIVCYSLSDTMVIYDRVRENLVRYRRMPLSVLIDTSINQTLSRTVLTAVTTLLALVALYLFGGSGLVQSFSATLIFGVLVGTVSSIYVAGPLLILFNRRNNRLGGTQEPAEPDASSETEAKGAV
ncbi:protein translocase subunit SecDF [Sinorhizobium meliloti]|uniref:protein translocase subunit SecDF n=1 Tax=Rhizobium meliloti TaxID=382 RepID=UPI000FD7D387|nr:protein translocase subunit SecDF [Sinorhizobium meliloti]MDW9473919.1 protein translocase subunit SecDF [Sinorhizobium meliloti]RVP24596.1 protein translocase subunit SecDF [Sinorhizobium meliloti]RVP24658.1 protein translocase subunit SecDF [Sinorhizobium meliloti]